ncbi:MAG: polysaccharide deacetylase family protein [Planctomycetota bacterium]|nr:polysaccharide deacetylase family protein [Planctomycetota bacterium]MDA1212100.1 polysaccharide deacetylase family protein [Planctomycetota bacterium]
MKRFLKQLAKSMMAEVVPTSKLIVGGPRTLPRLAADGSTNGRSPNSVALTFDDGPHPEWTPRLLDTLQENQLRGTFFVVGERAERHPELIRRIVAEGHTLGNHSYTHAEAMIWNDDRFLAEVKQTRLLLEEMTGTPCRYVRPPKGVVTVRRLRELWNDDQCVVLWNVNPTDFKIQNVDDIVDWCSRYLPRHGDVLLWHDNHPWAIVALNYLMSPRTHHPLATMRSIPLSRMKNPELAYATCELIPS